TVLAPAPHPAPAESIYPRVARLSGVIVDQDGQPYYDASLDIRIDRVWIEVTPSRGGVDVELPPGDYVVQARGDGHTLSPTACVHLVAGNAVAGRVLRLSRARAERGEE